MPDLDPASARRGGPLLTVLFWTGVGLAPLSALLLLLASGNGVLRAAAFLTVLTVVSIGLSLALRPDPTAIRLRMEETLLEELDLLRAEVRNEIAAASRATQQGFGQRLASVQQVLDGLRADRAGFAAGHAPVVGAAVGHVVVPPVAPMEPGLSRAVGPTLGRASVDSSLVRGARPADGQRTVPAGRAGVPGGVLRHTETVQVTTRSTYVDEHPHNPDPGGYDSGYLEQPPAARDWSPPRRQGGDRYEESWTDQKLRERYGYPPPSGRGRWEPDRAGRRSRDSEPPEPDGRELDRTGPGRHPGGVGDPAPAEGRRAARRAENSRVDDADDEWGRRWGGDSGQWRTVAPEPLPAGPPVRWEDQPSAVRSGARWAEVRTDERGGRELQVGERRTARHADETGTQWRIEDRWAAVRRSDGHSVEDLSPEPTRRALPAGGEPSWNGGWDEPAAHGWSGDDGHTGGQPRRLDFELSDERWR